MVRGVGQASVPLSIPSTPTAVPHEEESAESGGKVAYWYIILQDDSLNKLCFSSYFRYIWLLNRYSFVTEKLLRQLLGFNEIK